MKPPKLPSVKTLCLSIVAMAMVLGSIPQQTFVSSVSSVTSVLHHGQQHIRPALRHQRAATVMARQLGGINAPRPVDEPPVEKRKRAVPNETNQPSIENGTLTKENNPGTTTWQSLPLRIRVIDGRTLQPLEGAESVLIETGERQTTMSDGITPWFKAPYIRDTRLRPLVSELHGQLGVIVYKNGYRDSVHLGIRVHPGIQAETTVWMYKLGPGDVRIEPVLYEVPYHHLWLIELADRFRSKTQPGEGMQKP